MPECVFCQIRDDAVPAFMVHEDRQVLCFLDTRPLFPGHVLVVPRAHVEDIFDLPDENIDHYFRVVKKMAFAVRNGTGAEGVFIASNNRVSQSVPHFHTHVVPRSKGDGLKGFFWPRTKYNGMDEMADFASRIAGALGH